MGIATVLNTNPILYDFMVIPPTVLGAVLPVNISFGSRTLLRIRLVFLNGRNMFLPKQLIVMQNLEKQEKRYGRPHLWNCGTTWWKVFIGISQQKRKMLLSTSHNGYTDLAWSVEVVNKRALVLRVDDCQKPSCLGET